MCADERRAEIVPDHKPSPRVFVSYSHDTPEHKDLVLRFATFLRVEAGIDVHLDRWYDDQRRDWSLWAIEQLTHADFVVIVASPDYKRRADGTARPEEGRGAQFEAALIRDNLTRNLREQVRRVLPVVLPGRSIEDIPSFLASYSTTRYVISDFTMTDIADLLVAITGEPEHPMPRRGRFVGSPFAEPSRGSPPVADAPPDHHITQVIAGEIPQEPPHFVERAELRRVRAMLGKSRVVVIVTGMRGVGKTHLAAAIAREEIDAGNGLVGWINAGTLDTTHTGMAEIAARVGVSDPAGDSAKSARHLRDYLSSRKAPGLLVFDNATGPDEIRRLLPVTGRTRIIITTTIHRFTSLGEAVGLGVYTRAESVTYLSMATGLSNETEADDLTELLGDLPLALSVAAATIINRHLDYSHYRQLLTEQPLAHVLRRQTGHDYPLPLVQAILLSIQTVETAGDNPDVDTKVSFLLRVMAMLSPAGVQRILLPPTGVQRILVPEHDWAMEEALDRCASASLLSWSTGGEAVIMHKLVARILRERAQAAGLVDELVTDTMTVIQPLLFDRIEAWSRRELGAHIVAQIDALWRTGLPAATSTPVVEKVLAARDWAVQQLVESADTTRSVVLAAAAVDDCFHILGPDHPGTLAARHNIAYAYRAAGRLQEAGALYREVLADRRQVLGASHPRTLASLNGLAYTCHLAGNLTEAIPLFNTVLLARIQVLGVDHPDTLTSCNGLAYASASAGQLTKAIELYQKVLAERQRILGLDHPDTLTTRHNLAGSYRWAGRLTEAIELYRDVLEDRARVLGPDHPWTLRSRHNLAGSYRSAGRLDKAIELYRAVLTDRIRVLGADHPSTLITRDKIARTFSAAHEIDRAIKLYQRVTADYTRVLSADHPDALSARYGLARTLESAGQPDEAIDLYRHVIADRTRVLGPDHPDTLSARHHHACAHHAAGHTSEAIQLYQHVLADRTRVLGPDHPGTLASRRDLANAYQAADLLDDAVQLYQAIATDETPRRPEQTIRLHNAIINDSLRVLGPDHPDTLACRNNLAHAYESAHRRYEAIQSYTALLADCERVLSPAHPLTTGIRANLVALRRSRLLDRDEDDSGPMSA
ncbi:tetratricopeptide repeat protein [Nocardia alni]|uniref:tetratricopeptide repeat protein n=1 Tax=Nocardia alni TaxID=2815723 RepID=UPI001C21A3AE|nr:tetratricopeptide repeat protein [Nocardia alni]